MPICQDPGNHQGSFWIEENGLRSRAKLKRRYRPLVASARRHFGSGKSAPALAGAIPATGLHLHAVTGDAWTDDPWNVNSSDDPQWYAAIPGTASWALSADFSHRGIQ